MKSKKAAIQKWRGCTSVFAAFLAVTVGAATICETWRATLDSRTGTTSSRIVTDVVEGEELYNYKSDFANTTELVNAHKELAEKIQEEGFEINQTMVSIYEGIGGIVTGQKENMFTGQKEDEYGYQPGALPNSFGVSNETTGVKIGEPAVSVYQETNSDYMSSLKEYNDAAIVVVGRPSSEAADYYPGEEGMLEDEGAVNILGLTTNEREMISLAKENFEKVVVLINCNSPMEIEELKDDQDIDSIMWVGGVGNYGFLGVADVLKENHWKHLQNIWWS